MRDQEDKYAPDLTSDDHPSQGGAEPVDVVQVRADEALIAALGASLPPSIDDPIDDRLAHLLWSWRDDVEPVPAEPLVDADTAAAVVAAAPRPHRRHSPLGPFAAAAAVFVLAFIGLGLAAEDARPGDTLWNVTKVLYAEKAKSVEAAATVRGKLDEASQALDSGNMVEARVALQEAQKKIPSIAPEDGKQDLESRTEALLAVVESVTPQPTTSTSTAPQQSQPAPLPPPDVVTQERQAPPAAETTSTVPTPVVPAPAPEVSTSPPPTTTTSDAPPPPPTTPAGGETTGAAAPGTVGGQATQQGATPQGGTAAPPS